MNIQIVDGIEAARDLTDCVVIIDTFRASNTILALLQKGAEQIYIPSSRKQAGILRTGIKGSLYFAEARGAKLVEADYDNSPSQAYRLKLRGREVILYTSRGSKAISAPKDASEILIASFGNAQAIADYLNTTSPDNLTFVASGESAGQRAMEDYSCAEFIKSLIQGDPPDYDAIKGEIMEGSNGAKRLIQNGRIDDLVFCLTPNYSKIVPRAERKTGVVVIKGV